MDINALDFLVETTNKVLEKNTIDIHKALDLIPNDAAHVTLRQHIIEMNSSIAGSMMYIRSELVTETKRTKAKKFWQFWK